MRLPPEPKDEVPHGQVLLPPSSPPFHSFSLAVAARVALFLQQQETAETQTNLWVNGKIHSKQYEEDGTHLRSPLDR